ncbi:hypothetical protein LC605_21815 [Nostoc sp. CHAB 5836]|nr:hypothetical protein [Nostoc sp. CHAB 5836]MCC5617677.1 hypothetical protein [Nostoc sp. CHAB 5836]
MLDLINSLTSGNSTKVLFIGDRPVLVASLFNTSALKFSDRLCQLRKS